MSIIFSVVGHVRQGDVMGHASVWFKCGIVWQNMVACGMLRLFLDMCHDLLNEWERPCPTLHFN